MYDLIKEFIKPELLILIPVLNLMGVGFKKSTVINDKQIPLFLGFAAIILTLVYIMATDFPKDKSSALMMIFTGITQGVLLAGTSVYANQIVKQNKK